MKRVRIKQKRFGVSLIELLVVLSAATVILTLSTGLIHRLMHAQSKARALADVERTTLRLGYDLRRDVHHAAQATVDESQLPDGVFLRLQLPVGNQIEYRRDETTIRRIQRNDSRTIAREEFSFGESFQLDVNLESDRLVTLSITSREHETAVTAGESPQVAHTAPVDLQIVAALGQRGAQ